MKTEARLRPVTRIRGELQPSAPVARAVNRFLETSMDEREMRLYTTAQSVVELGGHRTRHAAELTRIEREFTARSLARRAFVLAPPLRLQVALDGGGRLFFDVQPQDKHDLEYVGRRLGVIEGLEESDETALLYVEIARGALARDLGARREQILDARDAIEAELAHPSAKYRMTANGLHVVTRDMLHVVHEEPSLSAAE